MANFIKKRGITEKQFLGIEKIEDSLKLNSLTSIPEGFNPTVGGSLYLNKLTSIPEGFNPIVDGYLYLNSLRSIPEGFNPTVGGSLELNSLTSIPEGFNPTLDGSLKMDGLTSIPEEFNATVGGSVYLDSPTSIPEGLGNKSVPERPPLQWQNGKYILADDRFSEVVSQKGNVYKLKDVNKENYYYLVTDGNGNYAHGDTIKNAKEDLIYKTSDRDKSKYENIDINAKYSFNECIEMYRTITGACAIGTRDFIESKGIKKKAFSVVEISELTKGSHGSSEFNNFFNI